MGKSVTSERVTDEDIQEAERIEMDVQSMLRLVDLIFLGRDDSGNIPS